MIESNLLPERTTQCCDNGDLQPTFLCFRTSSTELEFQRQPDMNFRQYIGCATVIFGFLATIQLILVPKSQLMVLALVITGLVLVFFLLLAWVQASSGLLDLCCCGRCQDKGIVHKFDHTFFLNLKKKSLFFSFELLW